MHKGGQINNVQLITGLRITEMSQLQNCSVMCTKNGSYCENEKKRKSGGGGMCTKNGSYCKKEKSVCVGGGGGQGRCERRSEAFVKIKKKNWGCRVWGGGGGGGGGQGGCEALVKIQKEFSYFFFFGGGGGWVGGGVSGWM